MVDFKKMNEYTKKKKEILDLIDKKIESKMSDFITNANKLNKGDYVDNLTNIIADITVLGYSIKEIMEHHIFELINKWRK